MRSDARKAAQERARSEATEGVERLWELADDLAEFNPGHGDYLTAARRIRAALDPEEPRRD